MLPLACSAGPGLQRALLSGLAACSRARLPVSTDASSVVDRDVGRGRSGGQHAGASSSTAGARCMSTNASSVEDQMIDFALKEWKGNHNSAIDVLNTGLSMHPGGSGLGCARLLNAMAVVEADRSNWAAVLGCTQKAEAALDSLPVDEEAVAVARLHSHQSALQALLVQGKDVDVKVRLASASALLPPRAPTSSPVVLRATALRLAASHALGDTQGASSAAADLEAFVTGAVTASSTGGTAGASNSSPHLALASALVALGDWKAKAGDAAGAASSYSQAADAAGKAHAAAKGLVGSLDTSSAALEVQAAALVGSAQLSMASKKWEAAEEVLGQAVKAAEGVSSDTHPRVALVLTLLGYTYSRWARVMYAEGMFREVAKILKLDPNRHQGSSSSSQPAQGPMVHASAGAMAAWRHSQLLAVLANRGGEAQAWAKLAQETWAHEVPGMGGRAAWRAHGEDEGIESVLGGQLHLKGQGPPGKGMLVNLQFRRGLPM